MLESTAKRMRKYETATFPKVEKQNIRIIRLNSVFSEQITRRGDSLESTQNKGPRPAVQKDGESCSVCHSQRVHSSERSHRL
ncbi:hypothetical protein Q7C36_001354 [Tachysurus vachellii]|uniref:Uncharacterized protein n=1 Tax=Tachysurus vachellii TaxID=175792 RepID=A0AA88NXL5_TACVA|nr:hypothetical protein Q7C36_001354 [Tachysurus vachellii]